MIDENNNLISEKTARIQRGRPFKPGQSGNPAGRPKGARNRTTLAVEQLLENEAETLTRVCIAQALEGDVICMRLCMERILPVRRERRAKFDFDLPDIRDAAGVSAAFASLLKATADGCLEVSQAEALARILEAQKRTIETAELEARIIALEERAATNATTK